MCTPLTGRLCSIVIVATAAVESIGAPAENEGAEKIKRPVSGKILHPAFAAALRSELKDNGIRRDEQTEIGSKQGTLTGSIFSAVPTLLVEMVNLAKREDARWISQPEKQQLMAQALLRGSPLSPSEGAPGRARNLTSDL